MFGRDTKSELLRDLTGEGALEEALSANIAILYKHSPFCPTSRRAMREVQNFAQLRREVPVYMVDVIRDRPLSQRLASELSIRHESPQVIVLRKGEAMAHGSHYDVTAEQLERWCSEDDA
ncbi:MAG: bacillithiol system redox-active protein YtxJ [Gemmatimonadota bacterium]|nr:MAG: bacillithiol system redox-active protein YtxJ [Gemmatimonadota bacterium]